MSNNSSSNEIINEILAIIPQRDDCMLRLSSGQIRDKKWYSLRQWTKKDQSWIPTKNGFTIRLNEIEPLITELSKIIKNV